MNDRITLAAFAILSLWAQAIPASAQTLIRVATPGALTGAIPIYLGARKGIFNKYGLNVEVIATRNETMSYEDPGFLSIPPYKYFDLSLIDELKSEAR